MVVLFSFVLGLAILDAESAVESNPTFSKAFYRRGTAYAALMKFSLALKDFITAQKLQPNADTQIRIKECQEKIRHQKFANAISSGTSAVCKPFAFIVFAFADRSKPVSEAVDLCSLEAGLESYTGPRYRREPEFLQELIDHIRVPGNVLHRRHAYQIVLDIIEELKKV